MFDIAWSELALIGAVALVVIGPKDLPKVMRTMGKWTRKARVMANEFQRNVEDMVREADLDEVRKQVQAVDPSAIKAQVARTIAAESIDPPAPVPEPTASPASIIETPAPSPVPEVKL